MSTVNGVGSNSSINVVDPSALSQQDFVSAVYLERGNMLDNEVRRLVSEVERSNSLMNTVNALSSKANVAQYGAPDYKETTWTVNNNRIVLDNGYSLSLTDGDEGNSFVLTDPKGNQLIYQNQTLIPVEKGTTADVLQAGIPVMQDLTMVLDDGTEITFKPVAPDDAFDAQNFSGGLADLTSVFITRGNQGVSITNLDGNKTPVISQPTVEGVTADPDNSPQTETITVPAGQSFWDFVEYGGSDSYSEITDNFKEQLKNTWLPPLDNLSENEETAMLEAVQSGLAIRLDLGDSDGDDNYYDQSYTYTPRGGESMKSFVERMIDDSTSRFSAYVDDKEGAINIEGIWGGINLPSYSYEKVIPEGEKTTQNQVSETVSLDRDYFGSDSYGKITEHANLLKGDLKDVTYDMPSDKVAGLEDKLRKDGMDFAWRLEDSDGDNDTYSRTFNIKMIPGEDYEAFIDRATQASADHFEFYVDFMEGEGAINIESIKTDVTIPGFSYDEYEASDDNTTQEPEYHSLDKNNNDGYILLESGGVHSWEYDGKAVANLTQTNPNDNTETVSGYFAKKLAFNNARTQEFASGIPTLTAAERNILTNDLNITFKDASGVGNLTPEEWSSLKIELEKVRNNLTGSSQLQTVQLQRALTTYTQNFDAMSNAQSRIYNLLKDMVSNMK